MHTQNKMTIHTQNACVLRHQLLPVLRTGALLFLLAAFLALAPQIVTANEAYRDDVRRGTFKATTTQWPTDYFVHVPEDYDPAIPYILILTIPGDERGIGQARKFAESLWGAEDRWGGNKYLLADVGCNRMMRHRIITASPTKILRVDPIPDVFDSEYRDDKKMLEQIMTDVRARYHIDEHLIFVHGFSAGGGGAISVTFNQLIDHQKETPLAGVMLTSGVGWTPFIKAGFRSDLPFYFSSGRDENFRGYVLRNARRLRELGYTDITTVEVPDQGHSCSDEQMEQYLIPWLYSHVRGKIDLTLASRFPLCDPAKPACRASLLPVSPNPALTPEHDPAWQGIAALTLTNMLSGQSSSDTTRIWLGSREDGVYVFVDASEATPARMVVSTNIPDATLDMDSEMVGDDQIGLQFTLGADGDLPVYELDCNAGGLSELYCEQEWMGLCPDAVLAHQTTQNGWSLLLKIPFSGTHAPALSKGPSVSSPWRFNIYRRSRRSVQAWTAISNNTWRAFMDARQFGYLAVETLGAQIPTNVSARLSYNADAKNAEALAAEGKLEDAVAIYARAVAHDPMNVRALLALSRLYEQKQDYQQAVKVMQQAGDSGLWWVRVDKEIRRLQKLTK